MIYCAIIKRRPLRNCKKKNHILKELIKLQNNKEISQNAIEKLRNINEKLHNTNKTFYNKTNLFKGINIIEYE